MQGSPGFPWSSQPEGGKQDTPPVPFLCCHYGGFGLWWWPVAQYTREKLVSEGESNFLAFNKHRKFQSPVSG